MVFLYRNVKVSRDRNYKQVPVPVPVVEKLYIVQTVPALVSEKPKPHVWKKTSLLLGIL